MKILAGLVLTVSLAGCAFYQSGYRLERRVDRQRHAVG